MNEREAKGRMEGKARRRRGRGKENALKEEKRYVLGSHGS